MRCPCWGQSVVQRAVQGVLSAVVLRVPRGLQSAVLGRQSLTCVVIAELAGVTFCTIRGVASGIGAVGVATALTGVGRWITCPWVDCVSNSCMP